jgi:tRNA-specific 2-thiouridylase
MYYTIGQRQGLGIGGPGEPWYVAAKDMAGNELIVVQGHDHPALLSTALQAGDLSWITGEPPRTPFPCAAKTRYRQADAPCTLTGAINGRCEVSFAEPQWAITPGQSVVLYDGPVCLGGGIIASPQATQAAPAHPAVTWPGTVGA